MTNPLERIFDALESGKDPHEAVYTAFRYYFDNDPEDALAKADNLTPKFVKIWRAAKAGQ